MISDYTEFRSLVVDTAYALVQDKVDASYWPGTGKEPEGKDTGLWSHLHIRQFTQKPVTLADQDGQRRHTVSGAIYFNVNHPKHRGDLLKSSEDVATLVQRQLTKVLRREGITVTQAVFNPSGVGEQFYLNQIVIRYRYDEVY